MEQAVNGTRFVLAGAALVALPSGALWWPAARLLTVADLHLGKAARPARAGGALLPPYEAAGTLARLASDIAATRPSRVLCLGDSFDHREGGASLDPGDRERLAALAAARAWVWVAGNHDPAPVGLPGDWHAEWQEGPIRFRHIARPEEPEGGAEVSGHYHPKARAGTIVRPCFVIDRARVILPAYGSFTGGLRADAPVLAPLVGPEARAVLAGWPALVVPVRLPASRPGAAARHRDGRSRRGCAG